MNTPFNKLSMRCFLWAYKAANWVMLAPLMVYLWWRGRRDPLYTQHLGERFGRYKIAPSPLQQPVWLHAVSLGELRSAVPLIKALLEQGEYIVITHFTPVGRRESTSTFAHEINTGSVTVVYVPLEYGFAFRRFYNYFKPKFGLVMEVEYWPCMIDSAKKADIPLFLCNGQYPTKSFKRDTKGLGLRANLVSGFAGVMVKSDIQASRFKSLGISNIAITGELRFDQPIPEPHLQAAKQLTTQLANYSQVITIASAVEGEDEGYIDCIVRIQEYTQSHGISPILFLYVPRAPERFETVEALLKNVGLKVAKRSRFLDDQLVCATPPAQIDVLLGDSMGEMYFYLKLADQVLVGGGFTPNGAHNISEALALSKPVLVGSTIWTIEYPAHEAIEAGVLKTLPDTQALIDAITASLNGNTLPTATEVDAFFAQHTGAVEKTLQAIPALLENTTSH